jgi:hypothetical protein
LLVEVERLPRSERRRKPKVLWLWWHGEGEPDLDLLWRSYCRRFDVEHFVKFLKQKLGWTTPRVRHPEQADRWTWLMLAAYAQLSVARGIVADLRLPRERSFPAESLTPTRVLRNYASLLPLLGTPARTPKPRGRSPGRPKGSSSGPAKRCPAIKKAAKRPLPTAIYYLRGSTTAAACSTVVKSELAVAERLDGTSRRPKDLRVVRAACNGGRIGG